MFAHWNYVLEDLFGEIRSVSCLGATHVPRRVDEDGEEYAATADDAAYATLELEGGVVAQINSSWATRVKRDDLLEIQVDGTEGSAVAGLRECETQHLANTPKPVWNPDEPTEHDFHDDWERVPDNREFENAFRQQWAEFLRHVAADEPFPWGFRAGARGVQLAELCRRSWTEGRRVEVLDLAL